MDTTYLTIDEAADICRVTPRTIQRWIAKGRIIPVQPGGRYSTVRIRPDAIGAA